MQGIWDLYFEKTGYVVNSIEDIWRADKEQGFTESETNDLLDDLMVVDIIQTGTDWTKPAN